MYSLHRLFREQVVLQPQAALPRIQRQRVGQGEHHEVVLVVVLLDERATVVDVHRHTRVLVRVVRVEPAPEVLDGRIDLDGVDVLCTLGQCNGDVVSVAGADDEHAVEVLHVDVAVGEEVETLDLAQCLDGVRGLVRDVVGRHAQDVVRRYAGD